MSALALLRIPQPRASDGDEVRTALEVATACWDRGDVEETVRWLRRASQAAAQADHLDRAMELSKWVAEAAPTELGADEETQPNPQSGVVPAGTTVDLPPPPAVPIITREPAPEAAPALPRVATSDDEEDDTPTLVRRVPVPLSLEGPETIHLDAGLVAVRRVEGRLEVTPLPAGGIAPPGSAVVMMVASSAFDADLLARWMR